jgi:phosphoglycerate dehydrogenase-like enzyme
MKLNGSGQPRARRHRRRGGALGALRDKKIAGAALDVFGAGTALGGASVLEHDNVIVTPHLGGFHDEYAEQALPTVEENVRKYLAGDLSHMINVVKR